MVCLSGEFFLGLRKRFFEPQEVLPEPSSGAVLAEVLALPVHRRHVAAHLSSEARVWLAVRLSMSSLVPRPHPQEGERVGILGCAESACSENNQIAGFM